MGAYASKLSTAVGALSKRARRVAIVVTTFAVSAAAVSGCAYRSGYGDRQLPGGYRAIAVPTFKNQTHETGAEVYFTNAIIRELERSKIGRVSDKANAQVTLEGNIESIEYKSTAQIAQGDNARYLPTQTALNTEYRILVTTRLRLRRNADSKILWESVFNGERAYQTPRIGIVPTTAGGDQTSALTASNTLYNYSARYQNLQTMAVDLMTEAHDRLTENF